MRSFRTEFNPPPSKRSRWRPGVFRSGRNISGDDAPGSHDRAFADFHPFQNYNAGPYPGTLANSNWLAHKRLSSDQLPRLMTMIVVGDIAIGPDKTVLTNFYTIRNINHRVSINI